MSQVSRYAAPIAALVREQAARGPFRFRVTSGSMEPLIRAGDDVLVRAVPLERLRPGDILLVDAGVAEGAAFVVHRLRALRPDGVFVTYGDRNLAPDRPWQPAALVGQVVALAHGDRVVDLTAGAGRARAQWLGRLARAEQDVYRLARAAKRAVWGTRRLRISVYLTRWLRAPFRAVARAIAHPFLRDR